MSQTIPIRTSWIRVRDALTLTAFFFAATSVRAQGTRADYERVANLLKLTENKVLNRKVEPHWFASGTRFWYRRELAHGGQEFVAERGQSRKGVKAEYLNFLTVSRDTGGWRHACRYPCAAA